MSPATSARDYVTLLLCQELLCLFHKRSERLDRHLTVIASKDHAVVDARHDRKSLGQCFLQTIFVELSDVTRLKLRALLQYPVINMDPLFSKSNGGHPSIPLNWTSTIPSSIQWHWALGLQEHTSCEDNLGRERNRPASRVPTKSALPLPFPAWLHACRHAPVGAQIWHPPLPLSRGRRCMSSSSGNRIPFLGHANGQALRQDGTVVRAITLFVYGE